MKGYAAPLRPGFACIAYRLGTVGPFYFVAKARGATNVCKTDCLMQKIDALKRGWKA
jgi:hypothetical protein